jgi:hypothetical protein
MKNIISNMPIVSKIMHEIISLELNVYKKFSMFQSILKTDEKITGANKRNSPLVDDDFLNS